MDISVELWHIRVRETRRFCSTITGTAHQGGCAVETRLLLPSGGCRGSIFHKFVGALDAGLPAQRQGRLKTPAHAGTSTPDATPTEAGVGRSAKTGSARGWLPHRDVDQSARGRANPPAVGYRLSSRARLENSREPALELPKARTAGPTTQPKENPSVEAAGLAAYKKKPDDCAHTWYSSMKAGSCSFRRCNAPGRPWAVPPCCGTAIAGNGSRSLEA